MRIPTLFALGTSELETKKFTIINLINSAIWTAIFVLGGFFFGELFTNLVGNIKNYEREVLIGVAIAALVVWLWSFIKNREEYN